MNTGMIAFLLVGVGLGFVWGFCTADRKWKVHCDYVSGTWKSIILRQWKHHYLADADPPLELTADERMALLLYSEKRNDKHRRRSS